MKLEIEDKSETTSIELLPDCMYVIFVIFVDFVNNKCVGTGEGHGIQ
jgi:hypothetical protein